MCGAWSAAAKRRKQMKDSLKEKVTYADMERAAEKWFMEGALPASIYCRMKETLPLAFRIAVSEYLTAKTETVCGRA